MLWPFIRIFVSMFLSLEMVFAGLFNGLMLKSYDMPEPETGEYTQYVDPFIGTGGTPWTAGMLSPAATVPFGTVRLGPDTSFIGGAYIVKTNTSGYYYEHGHIKGFSASRLSGTGAEDYQMFRVTPAIGSAEAKEVAYSHNNEAAAPGYYAVYLPTLDCFVELTSTIRTGVHRYTFGSSSDARLYIDVTSTAGNYSTGSGKVEVDENGVITGSVILYAAFSSRYGGLPVYFAATTDKAIKSYEIKGDEKDLGIDLNFGDIAGESVEMKMAISFVSAENAKLNLETETDGLTFDDVRKAALNEWEEALSVIDVESTDEEILKIFYTALYHSMIMPTNFEDVNGEYLDFNKEVSVAEDYTYRTDLSLWDTVRTTHSLYTLIAPEIQTDVLNSLLDMAEKGGAIPRWAQGAGYAGSMLGDPANILITESYLKGFDFDVETAYEYMKHSSEVKDTKVGRDYVDLYNQYGYVPDDLAPGDESVARTIEYSWEDGAIATLAAALGYEEDAQKYYEKSMNYKNTFNTETKYFQARNSDGSYVWNFSPYITSFYDAVMVKKFADCYCEGSARQWRWNALQDIDGMIELFGSEEYFVSELEAFMEDASVNRAAIDPGSGFWVGNQHDIHTPYLFSNAGRADLTQYWVRWTLAERFSSEVNGLDGNDDGGTLSSWYVFSSMGFYPLPGTDKYWIGSPNVDSAEIALGNGNTLKVTALNQSAENVYVKSVTLNGVELEGTYVTHEQLMAGGELVFTMSKTANK